MDPISSNPSSTAQAARQSERRGVPPQWLAVLLASSVVQSPSPPPPSPSPPPPLPSPPSPSSLPPLPPPPPCTCNPSLDALSPYPYPHLGPYPYPQALTPARAPALTPVQVGDGPFGAARRVPCPPCPPYARNPSISTSSGSGTSYYNSGTSSSSTFCSAFSRLPTTASARAPDQWGIDSTWCTNISSNAA